MANLVNAINRKSLGSYDSARPWYADPAYALNSVLPSFIHDYTKSRYYNSTTGASGFPFTNTRTSNATMFDAQGQLVWASANMIPRSIGSGAVLGVIGSGGQPPTGWSWGNPLAGITKEIVGTGQLPSGDWYTDFRFYGTNSGGILYPHVTFLTGFAAVPGDRFIASHYIQLIAGSTTGFGALGRAVFSYGNPGYIGQNNSSVGNASATEVRSVGTETRASGAIAGTNTIAVYAEFTIDAGATVDMTVRISRPQLERSRFIGDVPKTYIQTSGSAYYAPRFNYNPGTLQLLGLLNEPSSTNYNRNSEALGGVAGTPGTPPTNWGITAVPGVTITTSYGVENGMNYIDVTYSGTNSSGTTQFPTIFFDAATAIAALNGETWTGSVHVYKVAGADSEGTWNTSVAGRNSGGSLVGGQVATVVLTSSTQLTTSRRTASFTFTDPTIAFVQHRMGRSLNAGDSMDITWRIACPQLEKLSFPTSYIPTYGTQATRSADYHRLASASFVSNNNGVLYVDIDVSPLALVPAITQGIAGAFDGSLNNRIQLAQNAGDVYGIVNQGGVGYGTTTNSPGSAVVRRKLALAYDATIRRLTVNGNTPTTGVTAGFTGAVGLTEFVVGSYTGGGNAICGHIREVRLYPSASASNAQIQALTTL